MKTFDPEFRRVVDWVDAHRGDSVESMPWTDEASIEAAGWMRSFLVDAEKLPLPEPPPIVRQRLRQVFARHQRSLAALEAATYIPDVIFDTRTERELAGVRGVLDVAEQESFKLVFRSPVATVFLEVDPVVNGTRTLSGQVVLTSFGPPVFEATAEAEGVDVRSVSGNGLGEFWLQNVPDHATALILENGQFRLRIDLGLLSRAS